MPLRLKIHHKGLVVVAIPLVLGTAFLLFLYALLIQSEGEARDEAHANEVLHSIFILGKELFAGINALTAYSYMHNPAMDKRYLESRAKIFSELKVLKTNMAGYPEELKQLEKTERLETRAMKLCDGLYDALHAEDTDLMTIMSIRGMRTQMEALIEQTIDELRSLNNVVQTQSGSKSVAALKWRSTAKQMLLFGAAFNVLFSVFIVLYFSREITGRLDVLTKNANRLAEGQPLLPDIRGDDEIAELDQVFHHMAIVIEESKKRQKALVDNAVDVICSIDKDDVFTMVSPASEKVWGYPDVELVGKNLTDILFEEDVEETLNSLRTIKMVESTVPIENRVVCQDGKVINVLWSVYWSEQEETLYCVAHDITARKIVERLYRESEERTRSTLEGLPVGLIVVHADGTIQLANKKTQEMFAQRSNDLIGRNLSMLFKSADSSAWLEELITGASGHIIEMTAVRSDGTEFPVELSSSTVQASQGDMYLVAALDVTERHEIERLKREFVAMVSHDLKTPLSSVRGMLVLLASGAAGELPPRAGPIVHSAEAQLERLIKLINDLLDVQKMESGKFQIEPVETSIRDLLEQSYDAVERVADERKINIEITGGDARVFADPDRVVQVIINLLSNAIKFSPNESEIKVSIHKDVAPDFIEVRVADKGRGIKEEFKKQIFERFKQVEASDATEKKGTGLGLAICKLIIEGHGGKIGVESSEGEGSTFWFRLPSAKDT